MVCGVAVKASVELALVKMRTEPESPTFHPLGSFPSQSCRNERKRFEACTQVIVVAVIEYGPAGKDTDPIRSLCMTVNEPAHLVGAGAATTPLVASEKPVTTTAATAAIDALRLMTTNIADWTVVYELLS